MNTWTCSVSCDDKRADRSAASVVQKIALTAIVARADNQTRGHSCRTHGQAAVWVALNSVGPLLHADAHPSIVRPSGSCLRIFVSAIASKTRKLTSAAALPLSTASLNLEASLSRSCSTAATKCSLFRPTAFAKSQRGSHECRSCDLNRGGCLSRNAGNGCDNK